MIVYRGCAVGSTVEDRSLMLHYESSTPSVAGSRAFSASLFFESYCGTQLYFIAYEGIATLFATTVALAHQPHS